MMHEESKSNNNKIAVAVGGAIGTIASIIIDYFHNESLFYKLTIITPPWISAVLAYFLDEFIFPRLAEIRRSARIRKAMKILNDQKNNSESEDEMKEINDSIIEVRRFERDESISKLTRNF